MAATSGMQRYKKTASGERCRARARVWPTVRKCGYERAITLPLSPILPCVRL